MLVPLDVAPVPVPESNPILGGAIAAVVVLTVLVVGLWVLYRIRSQRSNQSQQQPGEYRGGVDDQRREQ